MISFLATHLDGLITGNSATFSSLFQQDSHDVMYFYRYKNPSDELRHDFKDLEPSDVWADAVPVLRHRLYESTLSSTIAIL